MSEYKSNQAQARLVLQNISVSFHHRDGDINALENLSFLVFDKEFVCILGPSGCGKTTILNLIAGFIQPNSGDLLLNGYKVIGPGMDRGLVFQQHNLFPWKTIRGNVEFGLRMRGYPKNKRSEISNYYLQIVGLEEFANHYPYELSVGMQQRVGLARVYANDPDILLMDEPFASLDAQTRYRMHELLLNVWMRHQKTVIFVTHDVDEAILLADRILLLSPRPGKLEEEVYIPLPRPRTYSMFGLPDYVSLQKRLMESVLTKFNS